MFNPANNLTLARILTIPVVVVLMYIPGRVSTFFAALVFLLASLTDLVDGFVARRFNLVTTMGKFLDPLADKLLVGSALIMLVRLGWAPAWVAVVIICRELTVTGLRAIAAERGMVMAADKWGKLKTLSQVTAVDLLLLHYPLLGIDPIPFGTVILYISVILTIFSGGNYLYIFYKNWLQQESTGDGA